MQPVKPVSNRFLNSGIWLAALIACLWLSLPGQSWAAHSPVSPEPDPLQAAPASPSAPFATQIVVTTTLDLDSGSVTKTCGFTGGIYKPASDGCTLRRAILDAAARPPEERPIQISFQIPPTDPNHNLEVTGTWTIQVNAALPPLKTASILDKTGQVTIDGSTQPGGRTNGPPIIIATGDHSLEVESTENVIRYLAFKGGGIISLKEDGNTVENMWMGLSDDGTEIAFRDLTNPQRMAGGGVFVDKSDNNTVRQSVISGAFAPAVYISFGDNNTVTLNRIGTRADGTVPPVPAPSRCLRSLNRDPQNWYGGWGIRLSGSNNTITQNQIAGLHILQSANDTPPTAIEISGADHTVSGNFIGIGAGTPPVGVGVCGQGILVSGSGTNILENFIYASRTGFGSNQGETLNTAILASDSSPTFGQITVRGNRVQNGPGLVYQFGPGIPQLLKLFKPAKITQIDGKMVTGTSGDGSPCPGCIIDFYQDDLNDNQEALSYLGSTTAENDGSFTFEMAAELAEGRGVRTASTTASAGIIGSYLAGTTTVLSELYVPGYNIYLPVILK